MLRSFADPNALFYSLSGRGLLPMVTDEFYLKHRFKRAMGYPLNLEDPRTFNEKLQWLKLNDRKPLYTMLVDKISVKDWVAERIGYNHIVPTIAVWDKYHDIDFDMLPERFVLKCSHDSGGLAICRNKTTFEYDVAKKKIKRSLRRNYYWSCREWPYKNVKPRILAEEYLENSSDTLCDDNRMTDYKFYCFNGEPKFLYISKGMEEHSSARMSFLTLDWRLAPFSRPDYKPFEVVPKKPTSFGKMIEIARVLSKDIPFVRVDLYEIGENPVFSEMTFSPNGGFMQFIPNEWDRIVGDFLDLTYMVERKSEFEA